MSVDSVDSQEKAHPPLEDLLYRFSPPLELRLDRERLPHLAGLIQWPIRNDDFCLLEALFQAREQRPKNSRRPLSERTYEFLSLIRGRLFLDQAVAARTALEWGPSSSWSRASWPRRKPLPLRRQTKQVVRYLREQGRYQAALPLAECSRSIRERVLGSDHPDTATALNTLVLLYYTLGRHSEALPLLERARAITEQALGPEHPTTQRSRDLVEQLRRQLGD
ncbi:hypothetical protein KTAU_31100 [Thermogemmatispora aurantia]|nr:hypothetical protein KTAU_31100 [Thermogemmatispora aurantia]